MLYVHSRQSVQCRKLIDVEFSIMGFSGERQDESAKADGNGVTALFSKFPTIGFNVTVCE